MFPLILTVLNGDFSLSLSLSLCVGKPLHTRLYTLHKIHIWHCFKRQARALGSGTQKPKPNSQKLPRLREGLRRVSRPCRAATRNRLNRNNLIIKNRIRAFVLHRPVGFWLSFWYFPACGSFAAPAARSRNAIRGEWERHRVSCSSMPPSRSYEVSRLTLGWIAANSKTLRAWREL